MLRRMCFSPASAGRVSRALTTSLSRRATPNTPETEPAAPKDDAEPAVDEAQKEEEQAKSEAAKEASSDVAALKTEVAAWKDKYVRHLAEMENVRERARRDVKDAKKFGVQSMAKDLLDVVDVLEMAITAVPEASRTDETNPALVALFSGLESTHKLMLKTLKSNGIEPIDALGKPFDFDLHMALFEVPTGDMPPKTVHTVAKRGYTLHGRLLRAANVGVTCAPPKQ